MRAKELFEADNLRKIANELYRFHQLRPPSLPQKMFPHNEQRMCEELREIYNPETLMQLKQPDYPIFRIAEPEFGDHERGTLFNCYLDNADLESPEAKEVEFRKLLQDTKNMLFLSDFKYAMVALPLSIEPIQKIRFIPYARQRFTKFSRS